MKTPRQILLEKHREAIPRLDAIRRARMDALRQTHPEPTSRVRRAGPVSLPGLALARWLRWGLAATWVVILALQGVVQFQAARLGGRLPSPDWLRLSPAEQRARIEARRLLEESLWDTFAGGGAPVATPPAASPVSGVPLSQRRLFVQPFLNPGELA
ncbi:MAG: hypothetical protein D6766_03265 [Verrucomicrobia bacterium]|nr:MAG: hypothetical protein D6766_03265 [Verrucomicrobiota bacterium]